MIEKDQILPPHLPKFPPDSKSLRNKATDDPYGYADTSRTDKDEYIENLKSMDNKNSDEKYKKDNYQHQHGNKIVMNKTK